MAMQALLKEQQEVLQRALDLHDTMVRKLASMDCQADLGFEANLQASSPPMQRLGDSQLLGKPAVACGESYKQVKPSNRRRGLSRWSSKFSLSKEVPWHCGDVQVVDEVAGNSKGDLQQLGKPFLDGSEGGSPNNWAKTTKGNIVKIVNSLKAHLHSQRQIMEATEEDERKNVLNVEDLYHETGIFGSLMKNSAWQNITFGVIILNTFYIALDTDYNNEDVLCKAKPFFQIMSNLFCGFFTVELAIRFCALKTSHYLIHDKWFLFDLLLVLMLVWETWIQVILYLISSGSSGGSTGLQIFSILRVFRVFRLIRALRSIPEIMVLIYGMLSAMRSVLATVLLLAFAIYLFGIFFTQLLKNEDVGQGVFETVPQSMQFLLIQTLCGADTDFMTKMHDSGCFYYALWLFFLFLSQLTIMNMLIGVVCNAVDETTEEIHNNDFVKVVIQELSAVISAADEDHSGSVSKEEFHALLQNKEAMKMLFGLGVDIAGMRDYLEGVYEGVDELGLVDVLDMVVQFRHSKAATVKDLLVLGRMTQMELGQLEDRLKSIVAEAVEAVDATPRSVYREISGMSTGSGLP